MKRKVIDLNVFYQIYRMHDQLKNYSDKILSKCQCEFRKELSTQHCLLVMIEKLRKSVGKGEASAALLTNLSKVFDCLLHDLLIAKLKSSNNSLQGF